MKRLQIHRGFALPAVLAMVSGLMVLLVALMTIVDLERSSAKAVSGSYRAELAVESAFEEAKILLADLGSTDTFVVAEIPMGVEYDDNGDGSISSWEDAEIDYAAGERGRPYLYGLQGKVDSGELEYELLPLFTTGSFPEDVPVVSADYFPKPDDPELSQEAPSGLEATTLVEGTKHRQAPVTGWRYLKNKDGETIARYSYWVEDLQGLLDAETTNGNAKNGGAHGRANEVWQSESWNEEIESKRTTYLSGGGEIPLWPAPGLNPAYVDGGSESLLSEIAVHTLDRQTEGIEDTSSNDELLRNIAGQAPTSATLLALSGQAAPLERAAEGAERGRLIQGGSPDYKGRFFEENFVVDKRSWEEEALIPYAPGIAPAAMGEPQVNLNRILEEAKTDAAAAVASFAEQVNLALPTLRRPGEGGSRWVKMIPSPMIM